MRRLIWHFVGFPEVLALTLARRLAADLACAQDLPVPSSDGPWAFRGTGDPGVEIIVMPPTAGIESPHPTNPPIWQKILGTEDQHRWVAVINPFLLDLDLAAAAFASKGDAAKDAAQALQIPYSDADLGQSDIETIVGPVVATSLEKWDQLAKQMSAPAFVVCTHFQLARPQANDLDLTSRYGRVVDEFLKRWETHQSASAVVFLPLPTDFGAANFCRNLLVDRAIAWNGFLVQVQQQNAQASGNNIFALGCGLPAVVCLLIILILALWES